MKRKILLLSAMFAMTVGALQAQYQPGVIVVDEQPAIIVVDRPFKPEKGSFTAELLFTPFGDNPFSEIGFKGRGFFNENWAFRFNVDLGFTGNKIVAEVGDNEYATKFNTSMFAIAPGFEYHFGRWERVSIYTGLELFYRMTGTKATAEDEDGTIEWINLSWDEDMGYYRSGTHRFGANVLLGTDIYIVKGLYMGAEMGLGFNMTVLRPGEIKEPGVDSRKLDNKVSSWEASFNCQPRIRLGWRF